MEPSKLWDQKMVFLHSDYMHHHGYHHVFITRKLARRAMMALMMSGTTFNGGRRGALVSIRLALPLWLGRSAACATTSFETLVSHMKTPKFLRRTASR